ncbi:hypothetical protein PoB_000257800 [Plakobranchus ocellatus]|uniref:Uncharacterized protein n=1 Tax=Plakobranchus ocellatus TaxID=259542 RepID=A0AAV3Y1F1_9GAST|nr:hypothetical protein PoB_000257800 [Plakobranchus ocellatus]
MLDARRWECGERQKGGKVWEDVFCREVERWREAERKEGEGKCVMPGGGKMGEKQKAGRVRKDVRCEEVRLAVAKHVMNINTVKGRGLYQMQCKIVSDKLFIVNLIIADDS